MSGRSSGCLGRHLVVVCERLRSAKASLDDVSAALTNSVWYLARAKYLLLESERANGKHVALPMCFAVVDDSIFLRTEAGSAKVRRIGRQPIVKVAACTVRGIVFGDYIECTAGIVAPEREAQAKAALRRGYGFGGLLFNRFICNHHVYLELTPLAERESAPRTKRAVATVTPIDRARRRQPPDGRVA
jgi:PPOX class probable F420-dependent enzyme